MLFITYFMSKSLVRARPFAKKKKPLSLKRMAHKAAKKTGIPLPSFSLNLSKTTKSVLSWSAIAAILLFFTFTFLIKGILFQEKFQITSVRFSQQTLETYEDIDLFNTVYRAVKDKNFYMLIRFDKEEVLAAIQEDFPQIQDIRFQLERNQETHAEEETEESTT
ncbi:hypothetical protein J5893_04925 [bacterium]|nr:hypothetical protein [bacterium]